MAFRFDTTFWTLLVGCGKGETPGSELGDRSGRTVSGLCHICQKSHSIKSPQFPIPPYTLSCARVVGYKNRVIFDKVSMGVEKCRTF